MEIQKEHLIKDNSDNVNFALSLYLLNKLKTSSFISEEEFNILLIKLKIKYNVRYCS